MTAASAPGSTEAHAVPVGDGEYIAQPGDCLASIAFRAGHFIETIWNHPRNTEIKSTRKDGSVLLPGDRLFVPTLRERQESCATDQKHEFVRKGVPAKLKLQFMFNGNPRVNERYQIDVDGRKIAEGVLDGDGRVEVPIVPDAKSASIMLGDGDKVVIYELNLGHIDPVTSINGIQQRLMKLGFSCEANGELDSATRVALKDFQKAHNLQETAEPDERTRSELERAHGC
jgi:hypothetical protein